MLVKRLLILVPLVLILFLAQSYLWIPTYEEQTKGNPSRLTQYITGSIGDAAILNPILSSDSASAEIENLVFEGLLDRDKDLNLRPRVAESWEIEEKIYVLLNPNSKKKPEDILYILEKAKKARDSSFGSIKEIRLLPPESVNCPPVSTRDGRRPNNCVINYPNRIMISLPKVEPDLSREIKELLGEEYYKDFDLDGIVSVDQELRSEILQRLKEEFLSTIEENPVITFYLRKGVYFHDGHPLTAEDVKFTYEAIMDPKNLSPRAADFEPVKTVEVIDPHTVRITYKRLYSPAIGTWGIGILPKHLLDRKALEEEAKRKGKESISIRESNFNRRPIGSGPFKFVEWKADQYIKLRRFENYWEGPPNYQEYVFRVIPDPLTQEMEFYSGTIDSYSVLPHQVVRLKNDPNFQNFSGLSFGYTYVGFNLQREPFNDIRVRKALAMAIDVEKIINYVVYGQGERITGPFPIQTPYYNHKVKPVPYDPKRAIELLQEAGYERQPDGFFKKGDKKLAFTLITNSGNDIRKAILAIVQDSWRTIGVDVRTDLVEWSVFVQERVGKRDFDALILGWMMGVEPDLYQIWHSSQTGPFQLNFVGFKNPLADELILKIRKEYNEAKRVEYCHKLHEVIAEQQPYIFLYCPKWTALLDSRIVIMETSEDGKIEYRKITPSKTGNYMYDFNKWIKLREKILLLDKG